MKKIQQFIFNLPIKWKLTLWSALMLFVIFAIYNAIQYQVIHEYLVNQEKFSMQQSMNELQVYLLEKGTTLNAAQISQSGSIIENFNQKNQLIRILNTEGEPILTLANGLPENWVAPKPVHQTELYDTWHYDEHLMVIRRPLVTPNFQGTIEIINSMDKFDKLNYVLLTVMILGGIIAIILSVLGGIWIVSQLLRPIQSLTETMRRIKQKGLHERMKWKDNKDEISKLTTMFNEMMDQLETSFQQQKQFVEDASHELRTPVTIIEGHLSLIQRWGKHEPDILDESLQASLQELSRLKGLVQELLALTRAEKQLQPSLIETVAVEAIIQSLFKNLAILHPNFQIEMEMEKMADARMAINPQHLEQLLLIVLDNAMKYSDQLKSVCLKAKVTQGNCVIQIVNRGIGIPKEELPYVFDRFYRVDKARNWEQGGHGLGLSIAKRLVENYQGTISIQSWEGKGTEVIISFPIVTSDRYK